MRIGFITISLTLAAAAAPASAQDGLDARAFKMLRNADANSDGVITRDELSAWRNRNFDRFDRNRDGVLSATDIGSGLRARAAGPRLREMLVQFDTNKDGSVSRAEFGNGPAPVFAAADSNRDGQVTSSEIAQAEAQIR